VEPLQSDAAASVIEPKPRRHRRLPLGAELALAMLPTITILAVLALVETYSNQRLLFASLASSAFLIYLDPQHASNRVRTLIISQLAAALLGFAAFWCIGPGYFASAFAMVLVIVLMILFDAVHPPAVSTALSFAFRSGNESNLLLFLVAVGMIAMLVGLQRASVWLMSYFHRKQIS
jgi:CBS-domain-containing membrane protein